MKPTKEQIKEFWEGYGFVNEITRSPSLSGFGGDDVYNWTRPDKVIHSKELPPIDLNNLFEYAVPDGTYVSFTPGGNCTIKLTDNRVFQNSPVRARIDLALALFWALWQVKEEFE